MLNHIGVVHYSGENLGTHQPIIKLAEEELGVTLDGKNTIKESEELFIILTQQGLSDCNLITSEFVTASTSK